MTEPSQSTVELQHLQQGLQQMKRTHHLRQLPVLTLPGRQLPLRPAQGFDSQPHNASMVLPNPAEASSLNAPWPLEWTKAVWQQQLPLDIQRFVSEMSWVFKHPMGQREAGKSVADYSIDFRRQQTVLDRRTRQSGLGNFHRGSDHTGWSSGPKVPGEETRAGGLKTSNVQRQPITGDFYSVCSFSCSQGGRTNAAPMQLCLSHSRGTSVAANHASQDTFVSTAVNFREKLEPAEGRGFRGWHAKTPISSGLWGSCWGGVTSVTLKSTCHVPRPTSLRSSHKEEASRLPEHRHCDCAIELFLGTTPLRVLEHQAMEQYNEESLQNGFIWPFTSSMAANFFFECLQSTTIFTKLDLRNMYNLVRIEVGDEWKTAFITLRGKPTQFVWSLEAQRAFDALKSCFTAAPVLAHPDIRWPFAAEEYTSDSGVRALMVSSTLCGGPGVAGDQTGPGGVVEGPSQPACEQDPEFLAMPLLAILFSSLHPHILQSWRRVVVGERRKGDSISSALALDLYHHGNVKTQKDRAGEGSFLTLRLCTTLVVLVTAVAGQSRERGAAGPSCYGGFDLYFVLDK
ncbi:hypothetical protein JZ751_012099 [Albula glossodonta]|uniref:Uncharacterized protein n=1 Tax=Albula glossodonta TaxID=121402 RepID=A0A8T2PRJ6_9TELE|nr:hypothetical protein JZ751_012099 [Albula glossodonta]